MILLVNDHDQVIGYADKMEVHKNRLLHRAFSIFLFDWKTQKMLLQKRAQGKYHSGGLWTNACCSHPRKDETMVNCLITRLKEELGLNIDFHIVEQTKCGYVRDDQDVIYKCGKFSYFTDYGEIYENEIDHVFLYSPKDGISNINEISFNTEEIEEIRWISIEELRAWVDIEPDAFTAWFIPAFKMAYDVLNKQSKEMCLNSCESN